MLLLPSRPSRMTSIMMFFGKHSLQLQDQGLSNICDPDYKPNKGDPYEQQLFEKQNFFSVLIKIIQTDFG